MGNLSLFLNIISPPDDLKVLVSKTKQILLNRYGPYKYYGSIAHITVNTFFARKEDEPWVLEQVKSKVRQIKPMVVAIRGFGYFSNTRTVFMKVDNKEEFSVLTKEFDSFKSSNSRVKKFFYPSVPHLTLASRLKSYDFAKLKSELDAKSFEYDFRAELLTVLKYDYERSRYYLFEEIPFGNTVN
ncbi:MAG: 2'-5' RNA ligase family protein [Cyclobacteriaceae bacterium]